MLLSDLGRIRQFQQGTDKQPTPHRRMKGFMYSGLPIFSRRNKHFSPVNQAASMEILSPYVLITQK
jgi:hypothetical protein